MSELEEKAIQLSLDKDRLLKKLASAKSCLRDEFLPYFQKTTFDFENKRLVGSGGFALQWFTRQFPDRPESYENQQTSVGVVFLVRC